MRDSRLITDFRDLVTLLALAAAVVDFGIMDRDDGLVAQAADGDRGALEHLLRTHGPAVRAQLRIDRSWQTVLDAEDVMQVTYLEAFLRIDQLTSESVGGFITWLKRIADNNLRDAVRALQREKRPDPRRRVALSDPAESYVGLLEQLGDASSTASRHASDTEVRQALEGAIADLPETYQKVVRLYDLQGLSIQDVAAGIGRSAGAVHMLRARAHDSLRAALGATTNFFSNRA